AVERPPAAPAPVAESQPWMLPPESAAPVPLPEPDIEVAIDDEPETEPATVPSSVSPDAAPAPDATPELGPEVPEFEVEVQGTIAPADEELLPALSVEVFE